MAVADRTGSRTGSPRFGVRNVVIGRAYTLVLEGELDLVNSLRLETAILSCADDAGELTLDLSELTFMDSTGLNVVLFAQQLCHVKRAEFALIPGPPQVQRLFEVTGLIDHLPFLGAD
jgi:anti-sigma B factor antagonist